MKIKIFLILIVLLTFSNVVYAQEDVNNTMENSVDKLYEGLYSEYKFNELDKLFQQENNLKDIFEYDSLKDFLISLIKGESKVDFQTFFNFVQKYFLNEVYSNLGLLSKIIFLSVLCSILYNISTSFGSNEAGEVAYFVIYLMILGLVVNSFYLVSQLCFQTIEKMVNTMIAVLPMLLILMASVGAVASSSFLSPILLFIINLISTIIKNIIIPLLFSAAVISMIQYISDKINVSKLADLIKDIGVYLMGFLSIVFLGVISIQGIALSTLDGISMRTAKYAVENLIPFIGGFLADSFDTIIGASLIIKNAVGIFGLIIVGGIILFPIIKIFVLILMYKISAAIIQPISDPKIVNLLNDISKYLILIVGAIITVAFMFFIMITLIITLGNVTVMYR